MKAYNCGFIYVTVANKGLDESCYGYVNKSTDMDKSLQILTQTFPE